MFKWEHVFSTTVDFPIEKVWDFIIDPKNWTLRKELVLCTELDEPIKTGSIVKYKIKNRIGYVFFVFTEVVPYQYYEFFTKIPLFKQNSYCNLQKESSGKTTVVNKVVVTSFLNPFLKSYYSRNSEKQYKAFLDKMIQVLSD